jgi:hypothetical protein
MPKLLENRLVSEFKDREYFTREELFDFYRYFEPELKEGTFGWRIHDLKNKNIIRQLKRGLYVISSKPGYRPDISPYLLKVAKQLTVRYDEVKYCIWESSWLNEFMQNQISRSTIFIEVEKGFEESVFYELKDKLRNEIFVNPDEKAIDYYIAGSHQPVIIKNLITRAPLVKRIENNINIYTPALEKILVDLYTEKSFFFFLKGSELLHIYVHVISNHTINFTRLLSYARRREKEQDIREFMINHMFHLVKNIVDD